MASDVLIVEDEKLVGDRLQRLTLANAYLSDARIKRADSLSEAEDLIGSHTFDLIFLDLNLAGESGFELLRNCAASPAHTVIVSANTDQAITAFEYGVVDFVAKPFGQVRLDKAVDRYLKGHRGADGGADIRYVCFEHARRAVSVPVDDILLFEATDKYCEALLKNGERRFHSKSMKRLEEMLEGVFLRVHKSWLVQVKAIVSLRSLEGSRYELVMSNGISVPVGRTKVNSIRPLVAARAV